jgi:hypothetical protein
MKKARIAKVAAILAALWATGANAVPIQVSYDGFVDGYKTGTIYGTRNANVAAGQFGFTVINNGGVYWDDHLQAFCIDVKVNLITSGTVTYDLISASASGRLDATRLSLIANLYDNHYASLSGATDHAAFQLALWEIIYNPTTLNLSSGYGVNYGFGASGFGLALSQAQSWLSGLIGSGYVSSTYQFFVLESPDKRGKDINQSLLLARRISVPEPGTLVLLGVGLIACGVACRRRSA